MRKRFWFVGVQYQLLHGSGFTEAIYHHALLFASGAFHEGPEPNTTASFNSNSHSTIVFNIGWKIPVIKPKQTTAGSCSTVHKANVDE